MDIEKIVQNIQRICRERGTTPTAAGKESGAGKDFVSLMKTRGHLPSVEKMSTLAAYLGVTTSDLLGEDKPPGARDSPAPDGLDELCRIYRSLNDEGREKLLDIADDMVQSGKYIKTGKDQLDKAKDA